MTVALGGDGSDELLAGYPTFPADRLARLYPLPRVLHERAGRRRSPIVCPVSTSNFSFDFKLKRFLRGAGAAGGDAACDVARARSRRRSRPRSSTGSPGDPFDEQRRVSQRAPTAIRLERLIYLYAKTYLQDDILVKVDRASMASSLEVRAPFLDVELVEFLGRVPPRLKLRRLDTKHLLKRAMADLLPPGIATRDEERLRHPDRAVVQGRAPRRAAGRARRRSGSERRASSSPRRCSDCSPSICPGDATTESRSGRSSCSSSGIGAGSRAAAIAAPMSPARTTTPSSIAP